MLPNARRLDMPRCCHCHITKPPSQFHTNRSTKTGLCLECKNCRRKGGKIRIVPASLQQAFFQKFSSSKRAPDTCWPWQGTIYRSTGYGILHYQGERYGAHRLSYLFHFGE